MTLEEFLSFFPVVDLPITLSEDMVEIFSKNNKVFPSPAIAEYISKWEPNIDEYVEFIPCIQLPVEDEFIGIVYWKGGLMQYEYIIITLTKKGELISRKSISSTIVEGETIKKSVASIDEDLIINIMAGATLDEDKYDPATSQAFSMEILPTGDILFSLGDE